MQPSDFLTILTIAVAVWAIIPKKERNFILLFFSPLELISFGLGLLFIHYLMAFDWLQENWASWLSIFTFNKGIPAKVWAYLVALIVIALPILKVSFGYFSGKRLNELIDLYKLLLKENEIDLLTGYISKYHISDIQTYLIGLSHLPEKESMDIVLRRRTESDAAFELLIKSKQIKFAAWVYGNIMENETFIKSAAPKYPELFATAFRGMETKRAANQDLVKLYVEYLFEFKNQLLIQELKITHDSSSSIKDRNQYYDLPILYGLFVNVDAASENYIWYPVGEGAVKSLKYDEQQKGFLEKEYDSDLEPELWNHKIWIATVYFDYMVRETIYQDFAYHMWLFYFRQTIDLLIENIPEVNNYKSDREYPSFSHYIICQQFDVMFGWIELAKKLKTDNKVIDTIKCLGWCVHSVCQSHDKKLSKDFKKRLLNRIVSLYCNYAYFTDNIACNTAREWLRRLFLNPQNVDFGTSELTPEYLSLLEEVWREFDKIPFTAHGNGSILTEFEINILQPLGVNY